jgi:DNA-binding CsgD family transcriptional regulator
MEHIWIFAFFICLVVGILAAFYAFQLNKTYRYPFLSHFVNFIIVFNLVIFLYLVTKYAHANFPGPTTADQNSPFYTIMFLAASIGEIGLIYTFIRVCLGLLEKGVPKKANFILSAALILVGISCVIGITTYMNTGSNRWIISTYIGVALAGMVILLGMSVRLGLGKLEEQRDSSRTAIRVFGVLFFAGYLVFFAAAVLPVHLQLYPGTAALLFLNVIPIFWLKKFFLRLYIRISSENSGQLLDVFAQDKQISKREREIMELILQGKSNKEIEQLLFISYNTVKNHIYNIYQKLGVNSRGQMIHAVLQAQRERENSLDKEVLNRI